MEWNANALFAHDGVLLMLKAIEFWVLDGTDSSWLMHQSTGLLDLAAVGHWQGVGTEQFGVSFGHLDFGLESVLSVAGKFGMKWNIGFDRTDGFHAGNKEWGPSFLQRRKILECFLAKIGLKYKVAK